MFRNTAYDTHSVTLGSRINMQCKKYIERQLPLK